MTRAVYELYRKSLIFNEQILLLKIASGVYKFRCHTNVRHSNAPHCTPYESDEKAMYLGAGEDVMRMIYGCVM